MVLHPPLWTWTPRLSLLSPSHLLAIYDGLLPFVFLVSALHGLGFDLGIFMALFSAHEIYTCFLFFVYGLGWARAGLAGMGLHAGIFKTQLLHQRIKGGLFVCPDEFGWSLFFPRPPHLSKGLLFRPVFPYTIFLFFFPFYIPFPEYQSPNNIYYIETCIILHRKRRLVRLILLLQRRGKNRNFRTSFHASALFFCQRKKRKRSRIACLALPTLPAPNATHPPCGPTCLPFFHFSTFPSSPIPIPATNVRCPCPCPTWVPTYVTNSDA